VGSTSERTPYGILTIERKGPREVKSVTLDGKPLELLSNNSDRSVWRYRKRFVVKVDRYGWQGRTEAHVYAHLSKQDRRLFAATLYLGYAFVIQRYLGDKWRRASMHNHDDQAVARLIESVTGKYNIGDMCGVRQWAITTTRKGKEKPVIHDYGISYSW